jgi:hypothetical protein
MRFLFIILFCTQLNAQVDTLGFMGDSHCNGGFGIGDSNWITRTSAFYQSRNPGTVAYKFCSGGETIRTNMPRWYPGSVAGKSIDDALNAGCNIIFFLQSGNHVAFSIPQDTSKWCYLKLADTLTRLGKRWAFSTIGPRQNTYSGVMDFAKYNAQADSLNAWLYATFPGHIFSLDTLRDKVTSKPKPAILLSDSLHYGVVGHRYMYQTTVHDVAFTDTVAGYTKIKAVNARFSAVGVTFDGLDLKYVQVYGSNDGLTFTLINYLERTTNPTISAGGYAWMKLIVYNDRKTVTITKRL